MQDTTPTRPTLAEAAARNVETGVLLLCREAMWNAVRDKRVQRTHICVLAAITKCINVSAKAWPSRAAIASLTGLKVSNVSNALSELRKWGHLIADREAVEEAGGQRQTVYTFGNVDHDALRREIDAWVDNLRAQHGAAGFIAQGESASPPAVNFTAQGEEVSPPAVNNASPPGVKVTAQGEAVSPPAVNASRAHASPYKGSNNNKNIPPQNLELDLGDQAIDRGVPDDPTEPGEPDDEAAPSPVNLAFEEFWIAFPPGRKHDKGKARKAFRKIVAGKHPVGKASAERLIEAAKAYAASRPNPKYTPLPTTWLNGGRWEDDVCRPKAAPRSDPSLNTYLDELAIIAEAEECRRALG